MRLPRTPIEWLGAVSAALLALFVAVAAVFALRSDSSDRMPRPQQQAHQAAPASPAIPTITHIQPGSQRHSAGITFLVGIADKCAVQDVYYVNAWPLTPYGEYTARIKSTNGTYDSGNLVGDGATADEDGTVINLPLKCGGFTPGSYTYQVEDSTTHYVVSFQFTSVLSGK